MGEFSLLVTSCGVCRCPLTKTRHNSCEVFRMLVHVYRCLTFLYTKWRWLTRKCDKQHLLGYCSWTLIFFALYVDIKVMKIDQSGETISRIYASASLSQFLLSRIQRHEGFFPKMSVTYYCEYNFIIGFLYKDIIFLIVPALTSLLISRVCCMRFVIIIIIYLGWKTKIIITILLKRNIILLYSSAKKYDDRASHWKDIGNGMHVPG